MFATAAVLMSLVVGEAGVLTTGAVKQTPVCMCTSVRSMSLINFDSIRSVLQHGGRQVMGAIHGDQCFFCSIQFSLSYTMLVDN